MDPILGAGLATAVGSVLGGAISSGGSVKANKANKEIVREQMAFQERTRADQYQVAMRDMKAAGLNPILAGKLGGAGLLSGASAQMQNESAALGEGVGKASSTASEAMRLKAEIAKIKADTALNSMLERQAANNIKNSDITTASQVRLQNAQGDNYDSQTALNAIEGKNKLQNIDIASPAAAIGRTTGDIARALESFVKSVPDYASKHSQAMSRASAARNAAYKHYGKKV